MKKPFIIFYCLITYAFAELIWWGILLIKVQPERKAMIMGEGAVFIFIFLVGAFYLRKALRKERTLHSQQKNFLLSVTHELKSPLASIKLYLETILKRDLEREQIRSFLKNSLKDIERLDDLVENMLIATKIENRSYSFPKEEFDFSELIEKVADRLKVHTCSTQTIKADIEKGLLLTGDKFALTSVVTNLIENAVKYSPPCSTIGVKLWRNNGALQFEVVKFRLEDEYSVEATYEAVAWAGVRWLKFADKKQEEKFAHEYSSVIMEDKEKRICFAVRTEWDLRLAQEKNPDVSFFKNSDYIE